MKKLLYFLVFFFSFSFTEGQSWNWAKLEPAGYDPYPPFLDHDIVSDDIGNIYFTENYNAKANIAKFNKNGNILWDKIAGCTICNTASVATYPGIEYLIGTYSGQMILETDTLNSSATQLFIAKFDSSGLLKWITQTNNTNSSLLVPHSVATDEMGNAYLTGYFSTGPLIFGNDTVNSFSQVPFIMKIDLNGNPKWLRSAQPFNLKSYGTPYSFAVDNIGDSYITGYYHGSLIFGLDTLKLDLHNTKSSNAYLVKYDSAGNVKWVWNAKRQAGAGNSLGGGVGIDSYGNAYLAGSFDTGTFSIGPYTFGPVIKATPYFSKFNSSGSISWAQNFKDLDTNAWYGVSVANDTLNNNYLLLDCTSNARSFLLTIGTDTFKLINTRTTADVLAEFDTAGNLKCGSIFQEGSEDDGDNMNVSRSGQYLYLTGDVLGKCPFGPDTISGTDAFFIASWQPCNPNIETGAQKISDNSKTIVFPNPNNGKFTIVLSHAELVSASQLNVEMYNILGEKVSFGPLKQVQGDYKIDISAQPSGIYFYRVLDENGGLIGEGKIIVQR